MERKFGLHCKDPARLSQVPRQEEGRFERFPSNVPIRTVLHLRPRRHGNAGLHYPSIASMTHV